MSVSLILMFATLKPIKQFVVIVLHLGMKEHTTNLNTGCSVCDQRAERGTSRIRSWNRNHFNTMFGLKARDILPAKILRLEFLSCQVVCVQQF